MTETAAPPVTAGRSLRLARHTLFNLLGQGSPFLAAVVAIPLLIRGLGTDRYGVLTLAWLIIGYFSLFDFGLSRALTQIVSERLGGRTDVPAPPVAWAGLVLTFGLGIVGAGVVIGLSPWLVYSVLKVPDALRPETVRAFYLLGAAIPLVVVTAGLQGILTAFHRFGLLNAIRAPMGVYLLVAPLAVLPFTHSLVAVTAVLVVGRIAAVLVYLAACLPLMPAFASARALPLESVRPLFRFGLWMSLSNIISPMLVYLDRLMIGSLLSVTLVAYYATPYEMITKVLIVPGAILGVLFPAFASTHRSNHAELVRLFTRGASVVALVLFPAILIAIAFAHEGLQLWLGSEFAARGAAVLRWLALGVFVNGLAQVFFNFIQGVGRPDLSARLHLVELPLYVPLLWLAIHRWGITGAAIAWTGRVTVDAIMMFWLASRFLGERAALIRRMALAFVGALAALALPALPEPIVPRAALAVLLLAIYGWLAWSVLLAPDDRASIRGWVARPA